MNSIDIVSCRLVKDREINTDYKIKVPEDAIRIIIDNFNDLDKEYTFFINCDNNLKPTNINIISVGTDSATLTSPKLAFKSSILTGASSVFILHNHPSDSLCPSKEDDNMYKVFKKAGEILGIKVNDSIIFNYDKDYYSMRFNAVKRLEDLHYTNKESLYLDTKIDSKEESYKKVCEAYKENMNEKNYNSYKELFDKEIKNYILSDIKNTELFDKKGEWKYYIPIEDLKDVGLGDNVKEIISSYIEEETSSEIINEKEEIEV